MCRCKIGTAPVGSEVVGIYEGAIAAIRRVVNGMAVTVGGADRKLAYVTTNRCLQSVVCGTCGVFQVGNRTVARKRPEEVGIGAAGRNAQVDGSWAGDGSSTRSHRVCGDSFGIEVSSTIG